MESFNLRFLLADDHTIIRQGLAFIIKDIVTSPVIFEVETLSGIETICKNNEIDILILDLNFPDGNSINSIPKIKELFPKIKILIFTAHDEDLYALRCLTAGADGFLSKVSDENQMSEAIISMINTGKYVSQSVKDKLFNSYMSGNSENKNPIQNLTNKEIEVANLLVKGLGNLEISNLLNLQKSTISTFKKRIFEKLNIHNIPSLIEVFNTYYRDK